MKGIDLTAETRPAGMTNGNGEARRNEEVSNPKGLQTVCPQA
ncbi:hypothetical protein SBV1_1430004 [Verrucomicrobia bacterium]|nr:hypothetical protein SBV1_1430004 [Verrucomicrobiota bacterium]